MGKKKTSKPKPVPNHPPEPSTPPTPEKFETIMTAPEIFALPHPNEDPVKLDAPFMMTRRMLLDIVDVMITNSCDEGYDHSYEAGRKKGIQEALTQALETLGKKRAKDTATVQIQTDPPTSPACIHHQTQTSPLPPVTPPPCANSNFTTSAASLPAAYKTRVQTTTIIPTTSSPKANGHLDSNDKLYTDAQILDWASDISTTPLPPPMFSPRDFSILRSGDKVNAFGSLHRR